MVDFVRLGYYLYKRRNELRYTQETVSAIIGISDRTLRNIEYGRTVPDIKTVMMLWDLYGLSPSELFLFYSRDEVMSEMVKLYINIRRNKVSVGK